MASAPQATASPDVLFYHLERAPVEAVLPQLLEKTLERGWRAVVQSGSQELLEALDEALWTYRADSFLPHGTVKDGHSNAQPVFLTTGNDTPNGAVIRFLVDRADPAAYAGYIRMVFLFDGTDSEALSQARAQWKAAKAAGCAATYWQQSEEGRWVKKA